VSRRHWLDASLFLAGLLLLALIGWGWRLGGLAVLQLGMGLC
jgi:hypothetical protein